MLKINIGCGQEKLDGYTNIDRKECNPDVVMDLNKGIKYADNTVDEIFAGCVLEQVDDFPFMMKECHRVLSDGGVLKGYVPSTDPSVMFLDPMDKRFFQEESFRYFLKGHHLYETFGKNYGFPPFREVETSKKENGIIHFILLK